MDSAPASRSLSILVLLLGLAGVVRGSVEVLHEFDRPGRQPMGALVLHGDGNYYGTTVAGGINDLGTVVRVSPTGQLTTLASFGGVAGNAPRGPLAIGGDGCIYGTCSSGGEHGFGTVFKVTTEGSLTKLADFSGVAGSVPGSVPDGLVLHPDGWFYGNSRGGGLGGHGTVYRVSAAGEVETVVEFTGAAGSHPGAEPVGALAVSGGDLFGVARSGGTADHGVIFRVSPTGSWSLLAEFTGGAGSHPGSRPAGGLFLHSDGFLYGTTEYGGSSDFGTAYRFSPGPGLAYGVLHEFEDPTGSQPVGRLVGGSDGALYGVTAAGGTESWGVVYRLTPGGAYSVLADYTGRSGTRPGAFPQSGLLVGGDGALYGAASAGGPADLGLFFRLTLGGSYGVLANLSLPLGWFPSGAPVPDGSGGLLFPVGEGGDLGGGALVRWDASVGLSARAPLGESLGIGPQGSVVEVNGEFFGVTHAGGTSGRGTAYKYDPATGPSLVASFTSGAGSASEGPLLSIGGTASFLGVSREGGLYGVGTVYQLSSAGTRARIVSFSGLAGTAPGAVPRGPVARAPNTRIFGVTERGGAHDQGVLYRLTSAGGYTVIAEFGTTGPRLPQGGLVLGIDGMLYGSTSRGGAADAGTLIRIDPETDTWSVVAEFSGAAGTAAGSSPVGSLAVGADGSIYGIAASGGTAGFGSVFRYSPVTGVLEALVSLTGTNGPAPGAGGQAVDGGPTLLGGVVEGADGDLYAALPGGGSHGGGVLLRISALSPIAQWKMALLGDPDAPDDGDPDFDGLETILEYALGLHPGVVDSSTQPLPELRTYPDGERLAIGLARDPTHSDLTVVVEVSSDLREPWTLLARSTAGQPFVGPGVVGSDPATPGVRVVEIRDLLTTVGASRRFLRIKVSR